jgi:hypothetical protein
MADEADLAWLRLPPPPQEPKVEMESTPSQEPKVEVKVEVMTKEKPKPDRIPRVDEKLKHELNRVEWLRVKSGAGHSPRVFSKPERGIRLPPSRSNWVDEPPTKPSHLPKDDLKRPRRFDETSGERPKKHPPRSGSPPPKGIRLFKGNLAKGKGPNKPRPQ